MRDGGRGKQDRGEKYDVGERENSVARRLKGLENGRVSKLSNGHRDSNS